MPSRGTPKTPGSRAGEGPTQPPSTECMLPSGHLFQQLLSGLNDCACKDLKGREREAGHEYRHSRWAMTELATHAMTCSKSQEKQKQLLQGKVLGTIAGEPPNDCAPCRLYETLLSHRLHANAEELLHKTMLKARAPQPTGWRSYAVVPLWFPTLRPPQPR